MMTELEKNFQWHLDNQDEITKIHGKSIIVVNQQKVVACCSTYDVAYRYLIRNNLVGQACICNEGIMRFTNALIKQSNDIHPDIAKIVDENFWDLT